MKKARKITRPKSRPEPKKNPIVNMARASAGDLLHSPAYKVLCDLKILNGEDSIWAMSPIEGNSFDDPEMEIRIEVDSNPTKSAPPDDPEMGIRIEVHSNPTKSAPPPIPYFEEPAIKDRIVNLVMEAFKNKSGDNLRDLAELVEAPVARPAEALAYKLEWMAKIKSAIIKADDRADSGSKLEFEQNNRASVIAYVMRQTGCGERSAATAIDQTNLSALLGWKVGLPPVEK